MSNKPKKQGRSHINRKSETAISPSSGNEAERQTAEREERDEEYNRRDDPFKERQVSIAERQLSENSKVSRFTLALVIVSFLGTGVALYQSHISSNALEVSTSSFKTDERAWIDLSWVNDFTFKVGDAIARSLQVNNVGKTPAFDVKGSYGFIVIRKEEQEPDYATWDKGEKGRLSVTPTFSFNLIMPNKPSAFFAQALGQTRIDTDHIEPAAARVPAEGGEYRVETMRFTEDIMESFRGRKAAFLCFGKLTY